MIFRGIGLLFPIFLFLLLYFFGLGVASAFTIVGGVALFLNAKISSQKPAANAPNIRQDVLGLVMIALGSIAWFMKTHTVLLYYPVLINLGLFILFFGSLFDKATVVERMARIQTPDLPAKGIRYTRAVTMVWCGFFVINGGIAFYTAQYASLNIWALYNGGIAYGLMGLLFGVEFLIRGKMMRGENDQS